ncbi:ABC transporter permease [Prauserella muralis]|uniref:Uncharacterized protein n=1 Tax=Prauserella muralis TaxID=588067 RepID=A0A2V4AG97_9PSEU|nr:ABC transporter permease [Prauserella muralis]PXY18968.1 hypothetical protein BAY60_29535 [Prauserella muralis]TWE28854.1 peptide/nickel transport system permease protein [Prauserella muralis]
MSTSLTLTGWRTRRPRRRPGIPVGVLIAAVLLLVPIVCVLFPSLGPGNATRIVASDALLTPSAEHWLGTDSLGRDVFARMVHGASSALLGPLLLASVTVAISTVLALIAGYYRGWADGVISRFVDVLYSVPPLVVAVVLVGVLGGGFWLGVAVLTVFNLPHNVRVLRAAVEEQAQLPYIEAAKTLGTKSIRILWRHLVPVISPLIVASFFLRFTYGIVDLSALSFLGLGVPPGSTDWGRMLAENRVTMLQNFWATAAPGLALIVMAVSANIVGDWLYNRYEAAGRAR